MKRNILFTAGTGEAKPTNEMQTARDGPASLRGELIDQQNRGAVGAMREECNNAPSVAARFNRTIKQTHRDAAADAQAELK